MANFREYTQLHGDKVWVNLDHVTKVETVMGGHAHKLFMGSSSVVVADWALEIPNFQHAEPSGCPSCGHDKWEHKLTWDGRLKCVICMDDEDRENCLVVTPEHIAWLERQEKLAAQSGDANEYDDDDPDAEHPDLLDIHSTA